MWQDKDLDERIMPKDYPSFHIGYCNAVCNSVDNTFLFTQKVTDGGPLGIAIKYNQELDTLWERTYDLFPSSYTYFRSNFCNDCSCFVLGEFNSLYSSFILKLSSEGIVVWNKT